MLYRSTIFNLDCSQIDLVPDGYEVFSASIECDDDQLGSTSLRGVVCYTGMSPGSTAVYSASPGCALSQESRVRTCMDNGLWSGAPAVVVSRGEGQGSLNRFVYRKALGVITAFLTVIDASLCIVCTAFAVYNLVPSV